MSCTVWGDSIALMIAALSPQCNYSAVVGRSPAAILSHPPKEFGDVVYISAGSNPKLTVASGKTLAAIRAKVPATSKVIWVLPAHAIQAKPVKALAERLGDPYSAFRAGPDHVHPSNPRQLVRALQGL